MRNRSLAILILTSFFSVFSSAQTASTPFRVAIVGLVHGHVAGFFQYSLHRPDIQLVGIAEPNQELAAQYAKQFSIDHSLLFADLEDMLQKTHPQAVLAYTNTYDHRRVVEICAKYGIPIMMEKPLAVSAEDAHAIAKAAHDGKIPVLVNYETTWYRSNHAAYDLVHQNSIGNVRKVVIHDGHEGPKEIDVGPEFMAWLGDPKLNGGGALYDFGCYGADLMTWLMDDQRPISVTAVTQQIKPEEYPRVDDEATIILTYPKAQAIIQAWNWPFGRKDMEVYGQTGYVITVANDDLRVHLKGEEEEQETGKPLVAPFNDSLSELKAVVLEGVAPDAPSSLETNVIVSEILDAARKSAKEKRTVLVQ